MADSGKTVKSIDEIDDVGDLVDTMRALGISSKGPKSLLDEMKLKVRAEMEKTLSTTAERAFPILSEAKADEDMKKREALKGFYNDADGLLDTLDDTMLSLLNAYLRCNVKENVKQHIQQLNQEKYFLLVAGETSSGKSSFVNLILGEEILPSAHMKTTATICEVKFGEKRRLVVHYKDKHPKEIPLDQQKSYQEQISPYARVESDHASVTSIKRIELFWPHSLLKKGIVIVDSPGVGESDEMDKMVNQYLSEAFAIIYVIDSAHAGGIQKDRIIKLFEKVKEVSLKIQTDGSKMAAKLPVVLLSKCALFVCNKWDQVEILSEKEIQSVKNGVTKELKRIWPGLDLESQIIYMSVKGAHTVQGYGYFTKTLSFLMNGLRSMISRSIDGRLELHWMWLNKLHSRLVVQAKSLVANACKEGESNNQKMKQIVGRLDVLEKQQDKVIADLRKCWEKSVDDAVRRLSEYLSSEEVIARFTSWTPDKVPKEQIFWEKTEELITEALSSRLREVIEEWEGANGVFAETSDSLIQQCRKFYDEVEGELRYLQRAATDDSGDLDTPKKSIFSRLTVTQRGFIGITATVGVGIAIALVDTNFIPAMVVLSPGITLLVFLKELKDGWNSSKYQNDKCAFMANASKHYLTAVAEKKKLKEFVQDQLKDTMVYLERIIAHLPDLIKADKRLYEDCKRSQKEKEKLRELYKPILDEVRSHHRSKVALFGITDVCAIEVSSEALDWKEDVYSCLGNGSFGAVYQGKMKRHGEVQTVALKVWKEVLDLNNASQIMDEIDHLREFDHPHIVKFYGISRLKKMDTVRLILVMEKCKENLASHIFKDPMSAPGKSEDRAVVMEICQLAKEITDGVAYIHDQRLVHRDLKPENILLSQENSVRIADVGLAKQTENITGTATGTPLYMAPEVFNSERYGTEADIYSLGIILWEMWYGQRAFVEFQGRTVIELFRQVHDDGKRPENRKDCKEPPFHSLMTRCWDRNPEKRPTAKECKNEIVTLQVRLFVEVCDIKISPEELDWKEDMPFCLGGGAFGYVYPGTMSRKRGNEPQEKIPVALKFCKQELKVNLKATQIIQEITPLRSLNHPNIVQFYGISLLANEDLVRIILVMEKCKENLDSRICRDPKSVPGKSENIDVFMNVCRWVQEITAGLKYIHDRGIVHRNLKLENILLSEGDSVKIADVGLAGAITGGFVETHVYMAPEVFHSHKYDVKTDIYSLGIIMWEMWYGQRAFAERRPQDLFNWVDAGNRPVDTKEYKKPPFPWECLMTQCWEGDPEKRPTAQECNQKAMFLKVLGN